MDMEQLRQEAPMCPHWIQGKAKRVVGLGNQLLPMGERERERARTLISCETRRASSGLAALDILPRLAAPIGVLPWASRCASAYLS